MMHFGAFFFFFCSSGSSFVCGGASFVLPSTFIFCYRNGIVISFGILVRAGILSLLSIPPPAVEVSPFFGEHKTDSPSSNNANKKIIHGRPLLSGCGPLSFIDRCTDFFTVPHSDSRKKWDILSPACN